MSFDPEALGRKCQEERDKRLRADGNDQYQEVSGEFAYFVEDPYIENELTREAIDEEVEVVIMEAFWRNVGCRLVADAGITDFKIVGKGGDFGGTWYWNRYPGASCDIEAYVCSAPERQDVEAKYATQQKRWNIAMSSRKPMV